jgi:hypothetical protein
MRPRRDCQTLRHRHAPLIPRPNSGAVCHSNGRKQAGIDVAYPRALETVLNDQGKHFIGRRDQYGRQQQFPLSQTAESQSPYHERMNEHFPGSEQMSDKGIALAQVVHPNGGVEEDHA